MSGYVELVGKKSLTILSACVEVLESEPPIKTYKYKTPKFLVWGGEEKEWETYPFWWQYRKCLIKRFTTLMEAIINENPVHVSLTAYEEIILLSKGDFNAQPLLILHH